MTKISFVTICLLLIFTGLFSTHQKIFAYGECSKYGIMAMYDSLSGRCKCMSGYVFKDGLFGDPQCVSESQACKDQYGYNARSTYGGKCECSYGYVFGKDSIGRTQCISEDDACEEQYGYNARSTYGGKCECAYGYVFGKDFMGKTQCVSTTSACNDQLGYNSRYNSLSDKCECRSGYVIVDGQCTDGNSACRSKHGLYVDYNSLNNTCECDSDYTFDDSNQCVKKQNNVYFTLKELNAEEKKAIVKSDYDYKYYLISYNSGCYSSSFKRYLNHKIVINLGTDFYLDTWDKIVLQDDNETCDITRKEYANSSTTLEPEEELLYNFIPETVVPTPVPTQIIKTPVTPEQVPATVIKETSEIKNIKKDTLVAPSSEKLSTPDESPKNEKKPGIFIRMFGSIRNFFSGIFK